MPKMNLRWLAGVVFVPPLLAVCLFFLHSYQMGRNSHVFLREARRAQAENRPADAVNHFRRYVKLAPKDPEGLVLYGMQLADMNQPEAAFNTLDRALQKLPERSEIRRKLVDLGLKIGRYRDAIDNLENYLLKTSPNDGELLEQLALCQIGLSEFEQAETTLKRAMQDAPERLEPYILMASIQSVKLNNFSKAMQTLDQMVTQNASNPKAYSFRSQWLFRQFLDSKSASKLQRAGDMDPQDLLKQVEADVGEALKLAPDDPESLVLAAQIAIQADRREEARELIVRGLAKHPSNPQFYTMLSGLEADSSNPSAALEVIRKGVEAVPINLDLQWNLARMLIESRQFDEANEWLTRLRKQNFSEALLDYLEGRAFFLQGAWLSAIEKFESVRPRLLRWPLYVRHVDFWLGTAFREINSPDQQLASYRRAVAGDPNWDAARLALAESLASLELVPEAISELQTICANPEAPASAHIALAKLLLRQNLLTPPNRRSWNEFDGILKRLEATGPQDAVIAVLRMQRQLVTQDYTGAVQTVALAREKHMDQIELWTADFDLALAGRDRQRVDEILRGAEKQFGDTVAVRIMKGRALVAQKGTQQETIAELRPLSEPLPSYTEAERLQLAEGFASLFLLVSDYDDAERLAIQIAVTQPKNLRIRLLLMDIARRAKRPELMDGVLKEIHQVVGEGAIWHYGEAERLVLKAQDSNDPEAWNEALAHLEKARTTRPTWERIPLLTAEIYDRRGESRQAIPKYLEAIRMGEKSPLVTGRVLSLLLAANRLDDAEKLIQQLRDTQSVFTVDMVKSEIALELQRGRKDQVKTMVEQFVRNNPQFTDPLWLGQVYLNIDNFDASAEQFRSAIAANRKRPEGWVGLVNALVRGNHPAEAETAIAEAKTAIPADQVNLTLGQCYELSGKPDLAKAEYRQALEKSPHNLDVSRKWVDFLVKSGEIAEAEAAVRTMLKENIGTADNQQAMRLWLRRNLVITLLTNNRREAITEALTLVDQNLAEVDPPTTEDLRLKANLLAKAGTTTERQQAIGILERIVSQEKAGEFQADDHWLLASLYQVEGDLKKWRAELRRSITDRKEDPRFLAAFVKLNLLEKEISQAEVYLDLLEKQVPNDLLTVDLKAQVLFARNRYQEVFNLLKKTGSQKSGPDERVDAETFRKYWAAKQFENYTNLLIQDQNQNAFAKQFASEATGFYEQLIIQKPELVLVFAEFLAGTDQVGRSLDLLSENLDKSSVAQVANMSRKVMRNPSTKPDQLARLQNLISEKSKAVPDSLALLLALTDLMSWRGDYEPAMKIYRKMIADDPKNTIALNNLAFLIALSGGGNYREALDLIDRAIKIGGEAEAFLDTRGVVHLAAGHSDKAVLEFEKAIAQKETAEEHFHASIAYSRTARTKEAREALQRAMELGLVEQDLHPIERRNLSKLREQLLVEAP